MKLTTIADRLGSIRAQIADLEAKEKELTQALVESGLPTIEGRTFRASVSHAVYQYVDYRRMLEDYDIDISPYSEERERVQVRVSAR